MLPLGQQIWLHCIVFWLLFGHIAFCVVLVRQFLPAVWLPDDPLAGFGSGLILAMLLNALYLATILSVGISPFLVAGVVFVIDVLALLWIFMGGQRLYASPWGNEVGIVAALMMLALVVSLRAGGLLDILADSWWHLGQANELAMGMGSGGSTAGDFLVGSYLWTGLLAWASILSGAELPWVWDAMTAWVAVITVAAYYLLARAICCSISGAVVAVLLFMVLIGGLNSGFRLFAWPAGLSYAAWYFLAAVFLGFLADVQQGIPQSATGAVTVVRYVVTAHRPAILLMLVTLFLIWLQHEAELFLFGMSILFYFIILCFSSLAELKPDRLLLAVPCSLVLLIMFILSFGSTAVLPSAIWVAGGILTAVLALGLIRLWSVGAGHRRVAVLALVGLAAIIFWAVDWGHMLELFMPEPQSSNFYDAYIPHWFKGLFGEWNRLPQWEHQLRDGLLWSATVSIPVAAWLYLSKPCRGYAFLLANALIPPVVLVSPYLFTFLTALIPEEGVYRIHLLIFHPIILAAGLLHATATIREKPAPARAAGQ